MKVTSNIKAIEMEETDFNAFVTGNDVTRNKTGTGYFPVSC
jgi:NOL1/NOP2/fmu family ribosome biogenesis protein